MHEFKVASYLSILKNSNRLIITLIPLLEEIQNYNMQLQHYRRQFIYDLVQEIASIIRNKKQLIVKVNNLLALTKFMQTGVYPFLLFSQIYILPQLQKAVQFIIKHRQFHQMTSYFSKQGYSSNIPNIQNLSYNYLMFVCQIIEYGTLIKPMKIYLGKQYQDFSIFYRIHDQLRQNGVNISVITGIQKNKEVQHYRERFLLSLSRWAEYEDQFIIFFLKIFQLYLALQNSAYVQNFIEALKYGQTIITSQIINRLIDVIANHQNFAVKTQALKLYDSLILWGDIEALLVINYSQYLYNIVKSIWKIKGQISLQEGVNIYPEIPNQFNEKQVFYCEFLKKLQCWAQVYPTYTYINIDNRKNNNEPSPINMVYRILKDKKKFKFPPNPQIVKFQVQSHKAFMAKIIRNQIISRDINGQYQLNNYKSMKLDFQQISAYYISNKQALLKILNKQDDIHKNMSKLIDFKNNFQDRLELIQLDSNINDEALNILIEDGLQLVEIINNIYYPYIQFLNTEYSEDRLIQNIINLCNKYFNPEQKKIQCENKSQNLLQKNKYKINIFQARLSNPLQKQLRLIQNNLSSLYFRQKYKQRSDKISNSNKSQQGSINLQIFTINKNSRTNRDDDVFMFGPKLQTRRSIDNHNHSLQYQISPLKPKVENKDSTLNKNVEKIKINMMSRNKNQFSNTKQFMSKLKQTTQKIVQSDSHKNYLNVQFTNKIVNGHPQEVKKTETNIINIKFNDQKNDQFSMSTSADKNSLQQIRPKIITPLHIPFLQKKTIHLHENHHYFEYLISQQYRHSYIYGHIMIFTSHFMTVQRTLSNFVQDNCLKVKIQLIIIPHVEIKHLQYFFEERQCIHIQDRSENLPSLLFPNRRYYIELIGQLAKIPLKLPIITIFMQRNFIFQYILPFTINNFMQSNYRQGQVIDLFNILYVKNKESYLQSSQLRPSQFLFPNNSIENISIYIPGSIFLANHELKEKLFIWQWFYREIKLFLVIQYKQQMGFLKVFGYGLNENKQKYHSFYRYIINFISHLLSQQQHKPIP